jgi:hypothetical protein
VTAVSIKALKARSRKDLNMIPPSLKECSERPAAEDAEGVMHANKMRQEDEAMV